MNHSSPLSVTTVPGCTWICDGNKFRSFGMHSFRRDMWKLGYVLGVLGIAIMYTERVGKASMTVKGPLNLGINFVTQFRPFCRYSHQRWNVESITWSPISYWISAEWCLFFCTPSMILASSRLSFVASMSSSNLRSIVLTWCRGSNGEVSTVVMRGRTIPGDWPVINWKPEKPVDELIVFMRWNQICGRAQTQPLWFCETWYWMAWFIVLLVHLLTPSVCGWYAVNIFSLTLVSFMRAFQNLETTPVSVPKLGFTQHCLHSKLQFLQQMPAQGIVISTVDCDFCSGLWFLWWIMISTANWPNYHFW